MVNVGGQGLGAAERRDAATWWSMEKLTTDQNRSPSGAVRVASAHTTVRLVPLRRDVRAAATQESSSTAVSPVTLSAASHRNRAAAFDETRPGRRRRASIGQ